MNMTSHRDLVYCGVGDVTADRPVGQQWAARARLWRQFLGRDPAWPMPLTGRNGSHGAALWAVHTIWGAPAVGRTSRVVVVVVLTGLAAGCAPSSHASTATRGPTSQPTRAVASQSAYLACLGVLCSSGAQLKALPTSLTPSGDGTLYITKITWRGWGTGNATGTGTAHANNCKPSCAQGTFAAYPATITLSDPRRWQDKQVYSHETISISAIPERVTFTTGLVPGSRPSPPPVATLPPTPGPVSTGGKLSGLCLMGYEPAYNAGGGTIAYGPFTPGKPIRYTKIGSTGYTPAIAYQVTLTNNSNSTVQVTGWAVAFYDSSGTELGSDNEPYAAGGTFITAGQSLTWTMNAGSDTHGNGLYGNAIGQSDTRIPSDGSAATCAFLTWYDG